MSARARCRRQRQSAGGRNQRGVGRRRTPNSSPSAPTRLRCRRAVSWRPRARPSQRHCCRTGQEQGQRRAGFPRRPAAWNAAGFHATRSDHDAASIGYRDHHQGVVRVRHRVLRRDHEMPAPVSACSVSASPWVPKSRMWLLAKAQASGRIAVRHPMLSRVHPIVHRFAAHELAGGGDCRFQIDQSDIGCEPIQNVQRFPHGHANSAGMGTSPLICSASET